MSDRIKNQGPTAGSTQAQELNMLTPDQQSLYWEALDCGATHNDAMEAATS
jgi:hypothetical protein